MAQIGQLDDPTLVRILSLIQLGSLIPLRAVCTKWRVIIETRITPKLTALKIFHDANTKQRYDSQFQEESYWGPAERDEYARYDSLVVRKLYLDECARFLARLFPATNKLFLHFNHKPCDGLIPLLNQWNSSLDTITFYIPDPLNNSALLFNLRMLWRCLQSNAAQPDCALRHLAITTDRVRDGDVNFPSLGPLSPNLTSLSLYRFGEENIGPLLRDQITDSITALTIELAKFDFNMLRLTVFKSKPNLKTSLTHLTLHCFDLDDSVGVSKDLLQLVATNCVALTHLDFVAEEKLHIEVLAIELKRFRALNHLTLRSDNKYIFSDIDPTADNTDLAVPGITHLALHLQLKLDKLALIPQFFPSVHELSVDYGEIICRCVSRAMERAMAQERDPWSRGSAICARCYGEMHQVLSNAFHTVSTRNLQFVDFNNVAN